MENYIYSYYCIICRTLDHVYGRPKGPLPDDIAATRRLLGMTDESIRRDVGELIQWLRDQPNLPNTLDGGEILTWPPIINNQIGWGDM